MGETITVNQWHGGSSKQAYTCLAACDCPLQKRGTEIFTQRDEGEKITAKHAVRPREEAALQKFAGPFPAIKAFSVERTLGSWAQVQPKHFADGGICDEIVVNR